MGVQGRRARSSVIISSFIVLVGCSSSSTGSSGGGGDGGGGATVAKTCVGSPSGLSCKCAVDGNIKGFDTDNTAWGSVPSCSVPVAYQPLCCAEAADSTKGSGERCTCNALVCRAGTRGCECQRAFFFTPKDADKLVDSCAPKTGEHCCNRLSKADCFCGTQTCVERGADDYVEVAKCTPDVMAKKCDGGGTFVAGPTCKVPAEL